MLWKFISITSLTFLLSFVSDSLDITSNYDSNLVQVSSVTHNNEQYKLVYMKRNNFRVRAKYFAYKLGGKDVYHRYNNWKLNKNIIMFSSGTYLDAFVDNYNRRTYQLVGLAMDQGKQVNGKLEEGRMEGLVLVYPNGGIKVYNIKDKVIEVNDRGRDVSFDISNYNGLALFKSWAMRNRATVFQTHLLAWNNELKFEKNYYTKSAKRERRFLAIGTSPNGDEIHCIVHKPEYQTLYDASSKVLNFLKTRKRMNVKALLNLDTGMQDVCKVFTKSGAVNNMIVGRTKIEDAQNLLVYYFQ